MALFDKLSQMMGQPIPDVTHIPDLLQPGRDALDRSESLAALTAFGTVLQIDQEHAEAWSGLGEAYSENGESDKAIEAFEKAVQFDPATAEYFLQLGREQLAVQKYPEAQTNLMQGLLLTTEEADTDDWYNLALCLFHQGKEGQAVPFLRKVIDRQPDKDAQQLLANCLYDLGIYEEAADLYQKVLDQEPDSTDALTNLGFTLEILGRQQEAIPVLQRAIAHDGKNADLYASLSRCYDAMGMEAESQAAAQKYHELMPDAQSN